MYRTLEAVYENGKIVSVEGKLPAAKVRVLVTLLGPLQSSSRRSRLSSLVRRKGALKDIKGNPVRIQRRMRDEW